MQRRYLFPVALLGASAIWSIVTASAYAPAETYDYLHDLVSDEQYASGAVWLETDLPHADKISSTDQTAFIRLIEHFDSPIEKKSARKLFIDQAEERRQQQKCDPQFGSCNYDVRLNRKIEPSLIHGDLRLLQVNETSIRQTLTVAENSISFGDKIAETRQFRFMLTEHGWVIKSVESAQQSPIELFERRGLDVEKMSGLNYYPHSAPWDSFWEVFPVSEIDQDLELVKTLGANAVRIFVQNEYFSNLETQADGLSKLEQFLDMCADKNIGVIVTLFDLRPDYRPQNWSRDTVHLTTILSSIHDHEALRLVDLKNQPDLDYESAGEELVNAWLIALVATARQDFPNVPLTIGWSDASRAATISNYLDIVSFHDYSEPDGLSSRLQNVKNIVGDKPVFVTEIGYSRWSLGGDRAAKQGERLQSQLQQLKQADGVFVWTLHDFDHIGSNVVGHRPWRKAQQKSYGIVKDGDWLPSAQYLQAFNLEFIPQKSNYIISQNINRRPK